MKALAAGLIFCSAVLVAACFSTAHLESSAPALSGSEWINGQAAGLRGRVTILHFWTFECINCRHNLPFVAKWAARYDPKEVQVIGIHTPELPEERNVDKVRVAVSELGIKYPILIDGKGDNWNSYRVSAWPTVFLIDKHGVIRDSWSGELQWNGADGFGRLSREIEVLRAEKG